MNKIFKVFDSYPNLTIGFSTKADGNLRIKPSGLAQIDSEIKNNRKKFLASLGISENLTVSAVASHSREVLIAGSNDRGQVFSQIDALVTNQPNIFLALTVADCLPIFLYDPQNSVIALIHAGWRGLKNQIICHALTKMSAVYHSATDFMIAGIGPHIGARHYEVQEDTLIEFKNYPTAISSKNGQNFLSLDTVAKIQLVNAGIKPANIEINQECTFELKDKYFSFRRDKPKVGEAMLAVYGIKN